MQPHRLFSVLPAHFWQLLLPSGLISFADILRLVALSWILVSDFRNAALLSFLLIANAVAKITAPLLVGSLINPDNRRRILFSSLIAGFIASCFVLLLVAERRYIYLLPFLEFLIAAAGAGFLVARQSLLRDVLADEQKTTAAGYLRASTYSTRIIAPAIAGLLLATGRPINTILASTAFFFLAFLAVLFFRYREHNVATPAATERGLAKRILFAIAFYRSNPRIRDGLIYFALTNLVLSPLGVTIPLFIERTFKAGPFALGLAETALGLGAVSGALIAARIKDHSLSNAAGYLAVLFFVVFVCAHLGAMGYYVFVAALFGIGVNVAVFGAKIDGLFMKDIPSATYPKIVGIQSMMGGAAFPLGLIVSTFFLVDEGDFLYLPLFSTVAALVGMGILRLLGKGPLDVAVRPNY